jgi:GNAT superfamily N-acetyltransferase
MKIRLLSENDIEDVLQLSILAWAPVFESFENVLGTTIFHLIYPEWKVSQRSGVEGALRNSDKYTTWVADVGGKAVGFITCAFNLEEKTAEVELLAVHPQHQNSGIGTELNLFALQIMREKGIKLAVVGTGGDPGHAPARRSYEKAGYTGLPLVRYYKDL